MSLIVESFRYYMKNFEKMFLLSLTILLPFYLIHIFLVNYWFLKYDGVISSFVVEILNAFLILAFMMLLKIPFIKFVYSDLEGEDHLLVKSYLSFAKLGLSLLLFGMLYAVLVIIGLGMFIVPGILVIIFLYLTPYISVAKNIPAGKCWREAIRISKKRFFIIFFIISLISIVEGMLSLVTLYGVSLITFKYSAVFALQFILNLILFPFICILTTKCFHRWQNEQYYLLQTNRSEELNV
ncbi:hypothetical protein ACNQFZ_09800 [Schinkia sp. CFF1]